MAPSERIRVSREDPALFTCVTENNEIQKLWKHGVEADEDWRRARDVVTAGERSFPPDLAHKFRVNIGECSVASDGILRVRENRIWMPEYEPLRTALMQHSHDSHLTGHPGRDTMAGIILQR